MAYAKGYKLFILDGVVSENMADPFREYAYSLYAERNELKREMKKHPKGSEQYNSLDA
jgi:hypothetical protein